LDTEFGVKPFSMDVPGQEADVLVSVARSADGAFYVAGENTLTRLDSAGNRLWSRYYLPYDDPYAFAQGSISTDGGNNVYVGLVALSEGYAHILKYGPDGTLLKDHTWPAQNAAVYGTALNESAGRLYAVFLDDSLRIAMLDADLNLLNSVSYDASAIVPAPGVGMDKEGNIYAGGWVYPGQNEYFAVKYSPELAPLFEFFEPAGPAGSEFGILDAYGTGVHAGGFYLSAWEYEAGGDGSNHTGIVNISSSGTKNWESIFAAPLVEYFPSGTDNAGDFYGAGYAEDWTPQLTKIGYDTGDPVWSMPEPHSGWIGGVIAGVGNALYTAGELMESSGTEYYYIARYTLGGDALAPAAVTDLAAAAVSSASVTLAWTAPGDDGTSGTAAAYDLRYTTAGPILEDAAFGSAAAVPGVPAPQAAGTPETFAVKGLLPATTYYFAIKAADEAGNVSELSNSLTAVTSAEPSTCVEVTGVPNWKQFNDGTNTWWDDIYDHTASRMTALGCLLTAAAQVVKKHGYDTTPGELNAKLIDTPGGFEGKSVHLPAMVDAITTSGVSVLYRKTTGTDAQINSLLEMELKAGNPVILELYSIARAGRTHFVVATRKCGDTVYINDPGNNNERVSTLKNYFDLIFNGNPKKIVSVRMITKGTI